MADRITLQVARYRPEEDSAIELQEYEVPCPKDWVVLDGLNYIKDRLDGTLSYRWSCRMGICGSCGMTVNGEPKLTCATFLSEYAPGPVRVEPLQNFPVIRDLSSRSATSCGSCGVSSRGSSATRRSRCRKASTCRRPERAGGVQAVQHVHQLHAVLLRLPDLRAGAGVHRPGRHRAGAALQPRLARRGQRRSGSRCSRQHEGIWGCTFVGRVHEGLPEARRSGRRHPALQADAPRSEWLKSFFMPRGAR